MELIKILKGTPWWVFVLFGYLVLKGIEALKPRVIDLKKLFILPLVFAIWGIHSLISSKLHGATDFAIWFLAMAAGLFLGDRMTRSIPIQVDHKKQLIALEGSPATLILSVMIFATKYFFGFFYATHPTARDNWMIVSADLITSGLIIGLFFGRSIRYWRRFRGAEHMDLIESK